MPYERAFSTLGCPETTLAEAFALAERHGLQAVEIRALEGTLDIVGRLEAAFGSPEGLSEFLRGARTRVAAFGSSLKLAEATKADWDALERMASWAEAAGGAPLRVFDGGGPDEVGAPARAAGNVRLWRALRARHSWKTDIVVETHDALVTAGRILSFAAACPGTRILWDSHHTWRKGGEDPLDTWRPIRGLVAHIHLKDSVGRPQRSPGYAYVPPGLGEFPMAPLRAALRAEFGGVASLEWERFWHPELPGIEDALACAAARGWW